MYTCQEAFDSYKHNYCSTPPINDYYETRFSFTIRLVTSANFYEDLMYVVMHSPKHACGCTVDC